MYVVWCCLKLYWESISYQRCKNVLSFNKNFNFWLSSVFFHLLLYIMYNYKSRQYNMYKTDYSGCICYLKRCCNIYTIENVLECILFVTYVNTNWILIFMYWNFILLVFCILLTIEYLYLIYTNIYNVYLLL